MKATLHHFTVTCPTCRVRHEWVSEIFPQCATQKTTNHIDCCGHEIGFSVRRQAATLQEAAAELLNAAKMVAAVWEGNNDFDSKDSERALYQAMRRMQEAQA